MRCLLLMGRRGPEPFEDGVVFSTQLADRIFRETGVRANYRARKQWGRGNKLTRSGPAHKLEKALQLVNRHGREGVRPPPQAGDSPHQEVRTKPEGRTDAGAHSLRKHGTPAGKGGAGSQWAYARLRPAEVAVGPTRPGFPPKSLEEAFEMGYAARRAEIELLKGGPSIAVSGTTSVTAEADRTYRGGLMPAAFVRDQWGRWGK